MLLTCPSVDFNKGMRVMSQEHSGYSKEYTQQQIDELPLYVFELGTYRDCLECGNKVAKLANRSVIVPFNGNLARIPAGGISEDKFDRFVDEKWAERNDIMKMRHGNNG